MIMEDLQLPDNINFSDFDDIFKFSFNQVPLLPIDISSGKRQIQGLTAFQKNHENALKHTKEH